ncbi:MAG: O-acetyl-ADP-ribose deacetylase [Clostridiales bacterium]|nr:O-acetyl-ADP-ribose deacetylase [Clostridiales bacterium]
MPFEIIRNDITKMRVDAIVNAANRSLLGGGGVDGAIHHAAGPELLAECRTLGGCETGEAKITRGYRLPAKYVIHTVGPVWHGGTRGERELLTACYRNSLNLALEHNCETVAFPLISAGAYGYPKDQAMSVAVDAISKFLFEHDMMVYLVVFGHTEFLTGKKLFRDVQEYIDDVYAALHVKKNVERSREMLWHQDEDAALDLDLELGASYSDSVMSDSAPIAMPSIPRPDWDEMLKQTDEGFSAALLRLIDEKGMTDAQCYKRANVDRKLFSKIRSNPSYKPSKPTVFAFAVALELSLPETKSLLRKAGFALSRSSKFDIILEYFIKKRYFNIFEINEVLFEFDMPLLGSGMNS